MQRDSGQTGAQITPPAGEFAATSVQSSLRRPRLLVARHHAWSEALGEAPSRYG